MNNQDKEAFTNWYENKESIFDDCKEAWQAACEYMRNKSNPLDALSLYEKLETERAENKKLRNALESIANSKNFPEPDYLIAREALKEVGEK
jgi:hypothetical protein